MPVLEFRKLVPGMANALLQFLIELRKAGDEKFFHPHAFTGEEVRRLAYYEGSDLYYVMCDGERVLGYGMLRGWDEGYRIPSLAIAVHPEMRGRELSQVFVLFLHLVARLRGARRIRLKVYPENIRARRLYEKIGYKFEAEEAGQLVGFIDL